MNSQRLKQLLAAVGNCKIGIIGDFCVDIYWHADMARSELSRETPHYPLPVVSERCYPGAAGNTAANIAALRPMSISAISIIGDDWRGMLLEKELKKHGISADNLLLCPGRFTNAYCKPMRKGISALEYEDPRLDFANYEPIDEKTENEIIARLDAIAGDIDVLCVSDQFEFGAVTPRVADRISDLAAKGLCVVVDSRYKIGAYKNVILKPNEVECWRAAYEDDGFISASHEQFIQAAKLLSKKNNSDVMLTLGERGSAFVNADSVTLVSPKLIDGEVDICGAGDTFLSAFSCLLAAGAGHEEAAQGASLASAVTVHKIGVTGTASPEEILEMLEK
ncbi:MAG: sugar kinase [Clostridiales bacterium]|nr:sugar kinase [Clostridiales bacterium]